MQNPYANKAELYARYRWDYAPQTMEALLALTGAGPHTLVADVGAGTGIFTRHWMGHVERVYAIEPEAEMRRFAQEALEGREDAIVLSDCRCPISPWISFLSRRPSTGSTRCPQGASLPACCDPAAGWSSSTM